MQSLEKTQLTNSGWSMKGFRLNWYVVQIRALRADSSSLTGSSACQLSNVLSLPITKLSLSGVSPNSSSSVFESVPSYRTAM